MQINDSVRSFSNYAEIVDFPYVYVPSAFIPNSDLYYDYFHISCTLCTSYTLEIYDRWGAKIFTNGGDMNNLWDGRYQGKKCPENAYVYLLRVTDKESKNYTYTGTVTLLR